MSLTKTTYSMVNGAPINVLDFGAIGDGITDDTTAIQSAIDEAILTGKSVFFPATGNEYLCGEVTIDGAVNIFGEGINSTLIRPTQDAGLVCWLFTSNAAYSSVSDMKFTRENGTINIGTAIKTEAHNIRMNNINFVHNEYGTHAADNFFYHQYTNVRFSNNSAFLADDAGDNNNNIFTHCYCGSTWTMLGGNEVDFIGCDFSSNPDIGDKPFVFTDPIAIRFNGLYCETIDTATSGTFDLFNFVKDSADACSVSIANVRAKGVSSGKYDTLFVFDDVIGYINGGYVNAFDAVCSTVNGGSAIVEALSKQSGVEFFVDGSNALNIQADSITARQNSGDPIANAVYGSFTGPVQTIRNGTGLGTTQPIHSTNKDANAGTTTHYNLYSAGTLAGQLVIDGNNEIRLVAKAASGRACLVEAGGQRFDVLSGRQQPSVDNTISSGSASARWSVVYAGTGTINTSDINEKQDVSVLSDAEKRVAIYIKSLVRKFKFKDAVTTKGNAARFHVGVIAQEVQSAFESEGLDAHNYGLFCSDLLPDGTTRLGVRYEELLAFVIAAL